MKIHPPFLIIVGVRNVSFKIWSAKKERKERRMSQGVNSFLFLSILHKKGIRFVSFVGFFCVQKFFCLKISAGKMLWKGKKKERGKRRERERKRDKIEKRE